MQAPKTILVGTDFSPGSVSAVAQAVRLAEHAGAALHVVHATRFERIEELHQIAPEADSAIAEHLREEAEERLGGLTLPSDVTIHSRVGKPAAEILKLAEEVNADLIILGATGSGGTRLGSVAGRCVRQCRTPLLLVPPNRDGAFEHVIAAVDLTPEGATLVQAAAWFAGVDGAACTAMHVYEVPWERARWGGSPGNSADLHNKMHDLLGHKLRAIAAKPGSDVEVGCELVESINYANAIIDRAKSLHADLIVTGTATRTALGYFVLGTTAEKLMRDSECAVLAIHEA
ncbi:MAG: universal stress protein [Phycisphaerales bacterium]